MTWLVAMASMLIGCSGQGEVKDPLLSDTSTTNDGPAGTGAGTGTATGSGPGGPGSASGTGSGTGGTTSAGLDCSADYTGQTPAPVDVCITQEVPGNVEVFHTNAGGSTFYDIGVWEYLEEGQQLEPGDLDGPERVYVLRGLSQGEAVHAELRSCDKMWLSYIVHGASSDGVCSQEPWAAGGHASGTFFDQYIDLPGPGSDTYDIEFVVEGYQGVISNYRFAITRYP